MNISKSGNAAGRIVSFFIFLLCNSAQLLPAQTTAAQEDNINNLPVREYALSIERKTVSITGKEVSAMTINGTMPGPTLRFVEGEYAKITVTNHMDVETSVHWHGLLLPNFYDGVPYLNTPPIPPGGHFTYEFPIRQSGTYWYHSHTMLQEQRGVFGPIIIEPKENSMQYDRELVLVFSDWTNDKPMNILRNLKRGNEWFSIKRKTAAPLCKVISRGALGAQIKFWKQRMDGADIADVYYNAFLANGRSVQEYAGFKPGEKVRLRVINAAASTNFWLTFGGQDPLLVSADGQDIVPIKKNKTFLNIAETYDYILTMPEDGRLEVRASAQDGSGYTSVYLGNGATISAPIVPRPDNIGMMQQIAGMKMKMGARALKAHRMKEVLHAVNKNPAMPRMEMSPKKNEMGSMKMGSMQGMNMFAEYNYDYLKALQPTNYPDSIPVREIQLDLTGNMNRYVWSLNGTPLSEADNIKIRQGEITRVILNNRTMMHHPMHLHGHFFRVLNKNGIYSPLKHTLNVPPMQKVTIEFYGDAYGDWIFHCHILYHMMGGMARVFSYGTPRDERMADHPVSNIIRETDRYYTWGTLDAASHMAGFELVSANIRNQFNFIADVGYNKNMEIEFTYDRYLSDNVRVFGGINVENETDQSLTQISATAIAGIKYFSPYMFDIDIRIDHQLRPEIGISRELMIFQRFSISGEIEYRADFGMVNDLENSKTYEGEIVWQAGAEYMLAKNFSIFGNYDNRFGGGGGLSVRF